MSSSYGESKCKQHEIKDEYFKENLNSSRKTKVGGSQIQNRRSQQTRKKSKQEDFRNQGNIFAKLSGLKRDQHNS